MRRLAVVRHPALKPEAAPQAVPRVVHDRVSWPALLVVGWLMLVAAGVGSGLTLALRPEAPIYRPMLVQMIEQVPAYDNTVWLTQPEPSQWVVYWIDPRGVLVQTWCQNAAARDVLLGWIEAQRKEAM